MKTKHHISILQLRQGKKTPPVPLLLVPTILQGREMVFCLGEEREGDVERKEDGEEAGENR